MDGERIDKILAARLSESGGAPPMNPDPPPTKV